MGSTDQMIARLEAEMEERNATIDGLVGLAEESGRDLTKSEMDQIANLRGRIKDLSNQLEPLRETTKLAIESRNRARQIDAELQGARNRGVTGSVEYRTAGAYIADRYWAVMGDEAAIARTETFQRAAAHQTTTDNPGLLPETIVGPVVNFVDAVRPIVGAIGVTDLGAGAWSYARITQHTQVGKQTAEKAELASRKMTITKTALGADTWGGYVNVSRQDIQRTSPAILDMVINDLAGQYAIETEEEAGTVMTAAATAGPAIPASPTAANVATAIWTAAGSVFTATQGQGRTIVAVSPDQLGLIAPIFPPINPQNAFSTGFDANLMYGIQGNMAGLTVIMSAGLATDTILVFSTAAVKCFEYRYGNLQVVEPSVWGVQVGYAGDFDCVVIEATGIVRVTTS